jgi:hypothetical protein
MVVSRAVENRTAVVMADAAYNTAIVDPYGHIPALNYSKEGEQSILAAEYLW